MKFIADAMLGRLARWLRLLGFDTLYYPDISDSNLLKIARQQERFILTRDTHFPGFKNLKEYLLINCPVHLSARGFLLIFVSKDHRIINLADKIFSKTTSFFLPG